jgi:uncharacterized membrane protein
MDGANPEKGHRNATRSWVRLAWMTAGGLATAAILAAVGLRVYAPSAGWAVASAVYIVWMWSTVGRLDGDRTRRHAMREDPSRSTSDTLLLLASIASLASLVLLLGQAGHAHPPLRELLGILGGVSVALSWTLVHTIYTVRYAALYYADDVDRSIDFNQDDPPRYLDFAYLAFTVGMTFQVSDTDVRSQAMRSMILRHMLISYLFGAVFIATAVNAVASLGG